MPEFAPDIAVGEVKLRRDPLEPEIFRLSVALGPNMSTAWLEEFRRQCGRFHEPTASGVQFEIPIGDLERSHTIAGEIREAIYETNRLMALRTDEGAEEARLATLDDFEEVLTSTRRPIGGWVPPRPRG